MINNYIMTYTFNCCYVNVPYGEFKGQTMYWRFHVCVCEEMGSLSECPICGSLEPDCANGGCLRKLPELYAEYLEGMIPSDAVIRQADIFENSSIVFPEELFSV